MVLLQKVSGTSLFPTKLFLAGGLPKKLNTSKRNEEASIKITEKKW